MTITISVPDQLEAQAADQGLTVEVFVERLARRASEGQAPSVRPGSTSAQAVADILELQQRNTLAGFKLKDLIQEGRKY